MRRRFLFGAAVFGVTMAMTAGTAFAYECYNTSRSARGNEAAAASPALQSVAEVLADPEIVGLCPAGVDFVVAGLEDAGIDTNILVNFKALMAGGLVDAETGETTEKGEELLSDGKGIDHLGVEFFATLFPLVGQAFGLCAP